MVSPSASLLEQAAAALLEASRMDEGAHAVTHKQDDDRTDASATHSHVSPQQQQQQQHGGDKVPFWSLALVCLFALLLRYGVSGGGYSGRGGASVEGGSPLHGDFEAQRHWMEITLNLPVAEWYEGTHPANDLQYWGLDYPPLTAYVSYVCGWVARYVAGVPELVELQTSRGHESVQGKLFMRLSVLLCDALFALPATILALRAINASPSSSSAVPSSSSPARTLAVIFLALIQPSFILIDHGHFQYNCVCLGLVSSSVYFLWRGHRVLAAAVSFCLALAFKQMALYYAPAFFAYMLAGVMRGKHTPINNSGTGNGRLRLRPSWAPLSTSCVRLALLGSMVLLTLGLMFAPWLFFSSSPLSAMGQVLHRLFPFARGLYEDKVANVWCATSVLVKWHLWFPRESMVRAALGATLAAMSPFVAHVFLRPSRLSFLYALAGSSLSFFLLSFQVHEKSFLLPLLPLVLLSGRHVLLSAWMGLVASFSMWPLLTRDGQGLNYAVLQGLFAIMALGFARNQLMAAAPPASPSSRSHEKPNAAARLLSRFTARPLLLYRVVQCSLLGCVFLHLVAAYGLPATALARWPDLASMLFVLYSAPHFVLLYAILLLQQWALSQFITEDEDLQALLRDDVGAAAEGPPQPPHKREEEAVPNASAVTATPSKHAQVRQRRK